MPGTGLPRPDFTIGVLAAFWFQVPGDLAPPCLTPASPITPVLKSGCGDLVPGNYASLAPHTPFSSVGPPPVLS
jgi:hypothetical protein